RPSRPATGRCRSVRLRCRQWRCAWWNGATRGRWRGWRRSSSSARTSSSRTWRCRRCISWRGDGPRWSLASEVMRVPRLLSVNVGLPRDIAWRNKTVHTAIWKAPVAGPCRARRLNLEGDGQGDLAGHGGEQRAVLVYQIESYHHWQEQLKRTDFVHGQFGENFTIEGLPDDAVCIGDRYQIGSALFEVTQPRVTCYRVGIRMNEPRMPGLLTS